MVDPRISVAANRLVKTLGHYYSVSDDVAAEARTMTDLIDLWRGVLGPIPVTWYHGFIRRAREFYAYNSPPDAEIPVSVVLFDDALHIDYRHNKLREIMLYYRPNEVPEVEFDFPDDFKRLWRQQEKLELFWRIDEALGSPLCKHVRGCMEAKRKYGLKGGEKEFVVSAFLPGPD